MQADAPYRALPTDLGAAVPEGVRLAVLVERQLVYTHTNAAIAHTVATWATPTPPSALDAAPARLGGGGSDAWLG